MFSLVSPSPVDFKLLQGAGPVFLFLPKPEILHTVVQKDAEWTMNGLGTELPMELTGPSPLPHCKSAFLLARVLKPLPLASHLVRFAKTYGLQPILNFWEDGMNAA